MRAGSRKIACGHIPVWGLIGDVEFAQAGTSKVPLGRLRVKGFVRAGSSEVPLGHLHPSCLRWGLRERARTDRIASRIGRKTSVTLAMSSLCERARAKSLLGAFARVA